MSQKTIPEYDPLARPLDGAESLAAWQDGAQRRLSVKEMSTYALAGIQGVGRLYYTSWTTLSEVTPPANAQTAEVDVDAGQHVDPVSGTVVNNKGVYVFVDGAGWERIADVISPAAVDFTNVNFAGLPDPTKLALATAVVASLSPALLEALGAALVANNALPTLIGN